MNLKEFVRESNRIERIYREHTLEELKAHEEFLAHDSILIEDLVRFAGVVQPDAKLRNRRGLNVYVGNHIPVPGGKEVETQLSAILYGVNSGETDPYTAHCDYEHLHPFTDGNGRSGRVLWLWMMKRDDRYERALVIGFLHNFYYQALAAHHQRQIWNRRDLSNCFCIYGAWDVGGRE